MEIWESISTQLWLLGDLLIAVILGGLIGWEREISHKPSGVRTNMLIALATVAFVHVGVNITQHFQYVLEDDTISGDPIRVLQAVIVGISFIGGGVILKSRSEQDVKYLTTAATILISTAVGFAVALHLYALAVALTLLVVIINYVLRNIFTPQEDKDV